MAIYRFRITLEDYEEVVRDIDARPEDSFLAVLRSLLVSVKFDDMHQAMLFNSDDFWRKGRVVAEAAKDFLVCDDKNPLSELKVGKLINYPHQKFLFVYDLNTEWTFLIEFTRVIKEINSKLSYPACTRTIGNGPRQYRIVLPPSADSFSDDEDKPARTRKKPAEKTVVPVAEISDEDDDDEPEDDEVFSSVIEEANDDASKDSYDEEEVSGLEGEEGEDDTDRDMMGDEEDYGGGSSGYDDDERY
jgi:hypothetical protein